MKFFFLIGLTSVLLSNGAFASEKENVVKIIVGGQASQKIFDDKKVEIEKFIGAPIEVGVGSADSSIVPLVKDMIDGVTAGAGIEPTIALAAKKGLPAQKPEDYDSAVIARVVIQIGIHPSSSVKSLSHQQVSDILQGKITTWEPITGEKKPLKALVAKGYYFTTKAIQDAYTDGKEMKGATFAMDKDGILRTMQADPGAIGFFGEKSKLGNFEPHYIDSDAKYGSYLITKKNTRTPVQKLLQYFRDQKK